MRTRIILTALLVLSGFATFAGNGETLIRKQLAENVMYIETAEKTEVTVMVQFTIKEDGSIVIDEIASESEAVKQALIKEINELKIGQNDTDVLGKTFKYRFIVKIK